MDTVLLVNNKGDVFQLEPPSETLYQIFERTLNRSDFFDDFFDTKLNRVSNSSWCFWSITTDFQIKLYVYKSNSPIQVIVYTYENKVSTK
jgi:hypothetical protein